MQHKKQELNELKEGENFTKGIVLLAVIFIALALIYNFS